MGNRTPTRFRDREEAGGRLADAVAALGLVHPLVVALPRGGVPVAAPVARRLGAPLEVLIVRKLGVPWNPEYGMGALAEDGTCVLDADVVAAVGVAEDELERVVANERAEIGRRVSRYRGGRAFPDVTGRTVVLVDDGLATGGTARAGVRALRRSGAARVVLAVPVAAAETAERLRAEVDTLVVLSAPPDLGGVGEWYDDFTQVGDAEVARLLGAAERPNGLSTRDAAVVVHANGVDLTADLALPPGARGLVLFAHGSGSSRRSPRGRAVAARLQAAGFATLAVDLLTEAEARVDRVNGELRFDVPLLSSRVIATLDAVTAHAPTAALPVGLYGASTGAAAVLLCAARRPRVRAVVCRGGRPDLATAALERVTAPVLLVVGEHDPTVLAVNQVAARRMGGPCRLEVVPGASHLFEEPGAIEQVATLTTGWFERFLVPMRAEVRPR